MLQLAVVEGRMDITKGYRINRYRYQVSRMKRVYKILNIAQGLKNFRLK